MAVSRRTLIKGGLMLPLATFPYLARGIEVSRKTIFIVLSDIDTSLPLPLVKQIFDVFFTHGIPVSAALRNPQDTPETSLNEMARLYYELATKEPGLFEIILNSDLTGDEKRYFQLREAIELRDNVTAATAGGNIGAAPIVSLLVNQPEISVDPYAYRAAGFRIQMYPPLADQSSGSGTEIEATDWGIAKMSGGVSASVEDGLESVFSKLEPLDGEQVLYISFKNAQNLDPDALMRHVQGWATRLQAELLEGNTFLTRPVDYLLQGNPGASKYVGLVLDFTQKISSAEHIAEFAKSLRLAGISYSALLTSFQSATPEAPDTCIIDMENADTTALPDAQCIVQSTWGAEVQNQTAQIVLTPTKDQNYWSGPRSDGRYHAALQTQEVENFARRTEADPMTDRMLLITEKHVATPIQREALLKQFLRARSDGKVNFYSVQEYVEQTLAPDAVLQRYWSTRRRQVSDPIAIQTLSSVAKEELLEDARLAWQYIEKNSDEQTGICAGTVLSGPSGRVDPWITLWDIASQIEGLISASSLSIISIEEARDRIENILEQLPTVEIDGLSLPPSLFKFDDPDVAKIGFDSCDTGRFLIILKKALDAGLVLQERAVALLDQWDLASTVRNQRAFSYSDSVWRDVTLSHCSHYSRNGYLAWGISVDTAYPTLSENPSGDQHMRLLYQAAFLGRIGAEPFLLEAMEIGFSPESRYLSDVLFDAQLSWYEGTGQLKCVSETPLDFDPWFSYQGLKIDKAGAESWEVSTISDRSQFKSVEFQERAEVISSKAAFLWAATYPHEHSNRLLALIREKARIEQQGFSVGVFTRTQKAMERYSDVNTNGIILAAISKMLNRN